MTNEQMESYKTVLDAVIMEMDLQLRKWGVQNHRPEKWIAIALEELGETAKAWLENKPEDYRREILQVAAVCVHAVDCLDRHRAKYGPA